MTANPLRTREILPRRSQTERSGGDHREDARERVGREGGNAEESREGIIVCTEIPAFRWMNAAINTGVAIRRTDRKK
jgi:hypothetical protein